MERCPMVPGESKRQSSARRLRKRSGPRPAAPSRAVRHEIRPWMRTALRLAGLYNLAFGAAAVLAPAWLLSLTIGAGVTDATGLVLWQCVGMIVGVYGLGYLIAAGDPARHWPIVAVGLLGKVLGPIGFVHAVFVRQALDPAFGRIIIANDLVWWVPFTLILLAAYRENEARRRIHIISRSDDGTDVSEPLRLADADGADLLALSRSRPLLIVFLRHFGCTFCRETLRDLAEQRPSVDRSRVRIVLVHMVEHDRARRHFARLGLVDAVSVSDPLKRLYREFQLRRASPGQLLGPRVWLRALTAGLLGGHGVGRPEGDGLQMPGAFIVRDGQIILAFRHRDAADRPDYARMVEMCGPRCYDL